MKKEVSINKEKKLLESIISIAGFINENKDAASIIPAETDNIQSITIFGTFLNKKIILAPRLVKIKVKIPAKKD